MTVVLAELPADVQQAVASTRERVARLHAELPRNALVVWTAGNVSVARAVWVPEPDFATSAECRLTAGAAHHTVMTTSTSREMWEDLAAMAGMELAVIDEDTSVRQFSRDLRLEAVWHRMTQGI